MSEESGELRRRHEESQRRRGAAEVPLEARPGRIDELPPGEVNRVTDLQDNDRLEPDPRHVGLYKKLDKYDDALLSASEATPFRSSTIPVFGFAANGLVRDMAKPTIGA